MIEWRPQSFKYPTVTPWTDFDFEKTLPPPYRPFRWGPTYNVTMGIRSMDFVDWIQVGWSFETFMVDVATNYTNKDRQ